MNDTDKVVISLNDPISYANKGEMTEGTFVELTAPNFNQLHHFLPIKQAFISAVTSIDAGKVEKSNEAIDDSESTESTEINGVQALAVMMQSSCDMTKIYLSCADLFMSGAALLDGEQKLTKHLLEKLSLNDFEKMVGEYIANFIAKSLMHGM